MPSPEDLVGGDPLPLNRFGNKGDACEGEETVRMILSGNPILHYSINLIKGMELERRHSSRLFLKL